MEVQMIGHASIYVKTQDADILMDPVLWDSHAEDIEDVCPKREVIHEQLPAFDLLIISHQHLDHFDLRSLAHLPKTVDVLIPNDKLIEDCLSQLGYANIYHLNDFSEVKLGSTSLLATRSENRVPEYGIVFADDSGVFWNQVDTVISLETISRVKSLYPQIDFLLANWQPMLEANYQTNQLVSFPYNIYSRLLENIRLIQPKAIAPGANGFKFINDSSWLNQVVFPVTQEQFCIDAKKIYPELEENIFAFEPGDIITFNKSEFQDFKQACQFVKKLENDRNSIDFFPTKVANNLVDENRDRYDLQEMIEAIETEICSNLLQFIREKKDSLFAEHCRWQVIYQLEIAFPNFCRKWFFDFSEDIIQVQVGRNSFANFFTSITASSLYGLLKQKTGWDRALLGGNYRRFQKIYQVTEYGLIKPEGYPIEFLLEDPLKLKFPNKEIFQTVRHQEVERWQQEGEQISNLTHKNMKMMRLGNHLVRRQVKEPQRCH